MTKYYSLAKNNGDRTADLYIFGDISDAWNTGIDEAWGLDIGEVSGLSIAKDLQALDVDVINVHINSLGGYTAEGLAILNVLKNHPAKIVTYCDGFACSAASLIFTAGDERVMGEASALYVHNAWSGAEGNAAQLRQHADVLEKISQAAGNAYAAVVNIDRSELDAMLDGENHEGTWILPEDAVRMGFATRIAKAPKSAVANQSVAKQILCKLAGNQQKSAEAEFNADALAEKIVSALEDIIVNRDPGDKEPKGINNFLTALSKR